MKVGTIPIRTLNGQLQVCLISSNKQPNKITVPKGGLKRGEELFEGALREMFEEAGLEGGIIGEELPIYVPVIDNIEESCLFFFVRVTKEAQNWPEKNQREKTWISFIEAAQEPLATITESLFETLERIGLFNQLCSDMPPEFILKDTPKFVVSQKGKDFKIEVLR